MAKNIFVNQQALDFVGLSAAEIEGTGWHTLVHPEDRDAFVADHMSAVRQKCAWNHQNRIRRNDGEWRWFDNYAKPLLGTNGEYLGHVGVSVDITERKRVEEALQESERVHAFQSAILESVRDPVWVSDPGLRIIYWNSAASDAFGWTVDEVMGRQTDELFETLVPGSTREEAVSRVLQKGDFFGECVVYRKDGRPLIIEAHSHAVRGPDGEVVRLVNTARDITERKKAEEALAAERQRFFDVLETLPVMICLITPDYHIPFSNKAFREKFGEAEGRYCYDYCCGFSEPCAFCESLRPFKTGLPHHWGFLSPDGSTIIDAYDFPFSDTDGSPLILEMNIDITDRRRAELALRESEEKYRVLFNSMGEGFSINDVIYDSAGNPIDFRYIEINRSYEEHTGLRANDIIGKTLLEIAPDMESSWIAMLSNVAITGKPEKHINYNQSTNRHYETLCFSPQKGRIAVILKDITQQKQYEKALGESESRFRAVQENSLDRFTILKPFYNDKGEIIDFTYVYQNARAAKTAERRPEELVGHRMTEVWHDFLKTRFFAMYKRTAETGQVMEFEGRNRSDGVDEWFRAVVTPIPDGIAVATQIITERKQAEKALQESEAQARRLVEQLKAADENKNIFLNTLSHELRNPLAAIDAWLQLVESSSATIDVPKVQMILRRQVDQLVRMVDDLLEISRIMNNKIVLRKETIDLNGIVEAEIVTQKLKYDTKGIKLDYVFPRSPVIIQADPARITQVVGNLLNNALKFTDIGGTVRVTVCENNDHAEISVADNGTGIEADLLPLIFTPFVQAAQSLDRSNGGMGIGLSIVKGITELHGGTVMAESRGSGKGATFRIRLPLEKSAETKREASERKGTKRALHILAIEDNKDLANAISMVLGLAGHTIAVAHDGLRGLEMFGAENPDIVLCDIGLPGIDGYEFARQIRAKAAGEHVYLIALSGYGSQNDVETAIKAGFDEYLVKPVNLTAIQETINKAFESRYKG